MIGNRKPEEREAQKALAERYSSACLRAAIAALAAAAVSSVLADRLQSVKPLEAFGSYVLGRELMDSSLEEIAGSPYRAGIAQALKREASADDTITLGELRSLQCVDSAAGKTVEKIDSANLPPAGGAPAARITFTPPTKYVKGADGVVRPGAPVITSVDSVRTCPGVNDLREALRRLWDDLELEQARKLSNDASIELYRWMLKRNRITGRTQSRPLTAPASAQDSYDSLNLRAIEELNDGPRTSIREFTLLVQERMRVETPFARLADNATPAAILSLMATLLFVAYFYFNVVAAKASQTLLYPGTVFATLMMTRLGQGFVLLLVPLPAIASAALVFRITEGARILGTVVAGLIWLLTAKLLWLFWNAHKESPQPVT